MKILLLLPIFLFLFFGCSHHQDFEQQKSTISVDWNSYNWLIDASTYCVVKYLKDSNFSLESKTLIDNFYSQLFQERCFSYPIPKSVSDEEKSIYEKTIGVSNGFCFFQKNRSHVKHIRVVKENLASNAKCSTVCRTKLMVI